MKLAISSHDGKVDSPFSPRFGRCEYFVLVDTETHAWETVANPASAARGGAGPQAVQFLANSGVEATITGRYGPNAYDSLEAAGIQGFEASEGTPEVLLGEFLAGKLKQVSGATGPSLH